MNILEKVAHLRALAARAGTPQEAEAAATQADAIILKYRLSEAEIEATSTEPHEICEASDVPLYDLEGKRVVHWRAHLAHNLARHYGCFVYVNRIKGTVPIYGRRSDVEIVRYMMTWLLAEIERASEREETYDRPTFRLGCVSGYLKALRDSKVKIEADNPNAAMVLVNRSKESEDLATAEEPRIHTTRGTSSMGSREAFERGTAAGASLQATGSGPQLPAGARGLLK